MAMQWEAVARMMHLRAKRDAVDSGQLLFYSQAVDAPSLPCSRQEYMGMLDFPNYNQCGNRAGLLPLHKGMRVRLAAKLSNVPTKIPLVNEAVGEVVNIRFHPREFPEEQDNFMDDPDHPIFKKGYVVLKYLPAAVFVKFDCLEGKDLYGFGAGVVAVTPLRGAKPFSFNVRRGGSRTPVEVSVSRTQLPLLPADVRTTQASQGLGMDDVFAFLEKSQSASRPDWWLNVYVMLSRARTLEGLHLWSLPDRSFFEEGPPKKLADALQLLYDEAYNQNTKCTDAMRRLPWARGSIDAFLAVERRVRESNTPPLPSPPGRCDSVRVAATATASAPPSSRKRRPDQAEASSHSTAPTSSTELPTAVQPSKRAKCATTGATPSGAGAAPSKRARTATIDAMAPSGSLPTSDASARTSAQSSSSSSTLQSSVAASASGQAPQTRMPEDCSQRVPRREDLTPYARDGTNFLGIELPLAAAANQMYLSTAGLVGMRNLGHTCYVNAALQVFLRVEPFWKVLQAHAATCPPSESECVWCAAHAQACTIRGIEQPFKFTSPVPVSEMVLRGRFGKQFALHEVNCKRMDFSMMPRWKIFEEDGTYRTGPQADAAEFWAAFISVLSRDERRWDGFGPRSRSVLEHELLGGIVRIRKVCANRECGDTSDACEWCEVHSLTVPADASGVKINKVSFQQMWDEYMQPRRVQAQLSCCCPDVPCDHSVQTFLEREPPLLYVRLDRVHTNGEKSHAAVDFPRHLHKRSGRYECVGIIHHAGWAISGGHYTATCRTSDRGGFRNFSDMDVSENSLGWSDVTQVRRQKTVHSLLYVRVDLSGGARTVSHSTLPYTVGAASQLRLP